LSAAGATWNVFAANPLFSMLRLFDKYQLTSGFISDLDDFEKRCGEGRLPQVSWVEPQYGIFSNHENDDHPPIHIGHAQNFVARIYNNLFSQGNSAWDRTLFIVTYDEHGGIFDHVTPPKVVDDLGSAMPTLGIRVPAFVISPWAKKAECSHQQFDHTSIIKTILERFARKADGSVPSFNLRVDAAKGVGDLLTETSARTNSSLVAVPKDPVEYYPLDPSPLQGEAPLWAAPPMQNDYQRALAQIGHRVIAAGLER